MTDIPVPTRQEVVDLLLAVLDGSSSRLAAAEWAAEMQENIESEDAEAVDPAMWHLLRLAATLDVQSGDAYLHSENDIREWIAGRK
jgi:hypothetical protein